METSFGRARSGSRQARVDQLEALGVCVSLCARLGVMGTEKARMRRVSTGEAFEKTGHFGVRGAS